MVNTKITAEVMNYSTHGSLYQQYEDDANLDHSEPYLESRCCDWCGNDYDEYYDNEWEGYCSEQCKHQEHKERKID